MIQSPPSISYSNNSTANGNTTTTSTTTTNHNDEKLKQEQEQLHQSQPYFSVKAIEFGNKKRCIVTQKENGPCPLISIVNLLSLRGDINVPEGASLTYQDLITRIGSYLIENIPVNYKTKEEQYDYEIKLNQTINILPQLVNGLILNIKFTGIFDFDSSCDTNIFDFLNIKLVHGWLVDPQDVELVSIIGDLTYNQLTEKLYLQQGNNSNSSSSNGKLKQQPPPKQSSNPFDNDLFEFSSMTTTTTTTTTSTTSNSNNTKYNPFNTFDDDFQHDSFTSGLSSSDDIATDLKIQQFFKDTSTQLSYHGLTELHTKLPDNSLAILFRNNHFCTILKQNSQLFLLITDEGYINEPVVWEHLSQIDGDTDFLTCEFKPYQKKDPYSKFSNSPQIKSQQPSANGTPAALQQVSQSAPPVPIEFMTDEEYANYLQSQQPSNQNTDEDYQVAFQLQQQENQKRIKSKKEKVKKQDKKQIQDEEDGSDLKQKKDKSCKLQ